MRLLRQVGQEKLNREGPPMRARAIVLPGGVTGRDAPERGAPRLRGTWTRKCQGSQMLNRPPLFHHYATLECRKENAGALPKRRCGRKNRKNTISFCSGYIIRNLNTAVNTVFGFFWEPKLLNIRCEKGREGLEIQDLAGSGDKKCCARRGRDE